MREGRQRRNERDGEGMRERKWGGNERGETHGMREMEKE